MLIFKELLSNKFVSVKKQFVYDFDRCQKNLTYYGIFINLAGKCLGIKSAASSRSGSSTKVQLKQKFSDAVSKKQSSDKYSGDHSSVKTSKSSKSKKSSDKDSKSSSRGTKSSGKASKSSSKRSKSSAKESKSSGKESKSGSESGLRLVVLFKNKKPKTKQVILTNIQLLHQRHVQELEKIQLQIDERFEEVYRKF